MRNERRAQYESTSALIGSTPFRSLTGLSQATGSSIFVKEEYRNPTGSHYDRIMFRLIRDREESGAFVPGRSHLLDVTSGNSGASLAWLARVLKYDCTIIMPSDMPIPRRRQIEAFGSNLVFSPAGEYVGGAIRVLREHLRNASELYDHLALVNHAADKLSTPTAMLSLGEEIVADCAAFAVAHIDYVVCALGNGSSLALTDPLIAALGARAIGFEPAENPGNFVARHGIEEYMRLYGTSPPSSLDHGLLGTGPGVTSFDWPLLQQRIGAVEDIVLVSRDEWQAEQATMQDSDGLHCGRTTAAAYHVARGLAERHPGCTTVIIGYDPAWKYYD